MLRLVIEQPIVLPSMEYSLDRDSWQWNAWTCRPLLLDDEEHFWYLDALKQLQNKFKSLKIGLEQFITYELYSQVLKMLMGRKCICNRLTYWKVGVFALHPYLHHVCNKIYMSKNIQLEEEWWHHFLLFCGIGWWGRWVPFIIFPSCPFSWL